ncbi:hypothetical protein HJG60_012298 [Phyllostomus discolor]|uniref:Uncharacterized protein n=1 Tax=Phyllostomus discolor TaxID=89673 RepID=A0A833ZE88_9CHIR|nr:hypothetical protein HJG60_012298 [Phyllostomus discolor]
MNPASVSTHSVHESVSDCSQRIGDAGNLGKCAGYLLSESCFDLREKSWHCSRVMRRCRKERRKIPYNVTTQRYLEILCLFFQSFIHTRTCLQSCPGIRGGGFQGRPRAPKPTGAPVLYMKRNIRTHAMHILPWRL